VRDGEFVEHWDELNTLDLARQLGSIALLRAGLVIGVGALRSTILRTVPR
jgi:hypothetical protein